MDDLIYNVGQEINDINTLIHFCSFNKNYRNNLFNTKYFWIKHIEKYFVLFCIKDVNYNYTHEWIHLLLKTQYVNHKLNKLDSYPTVQLCIKLNLNNFLKVVNVCDGEEIINYLDDEFESEEMETLFENKYPFIIERISISKDLMVLFFKQNYPDLKLEDPIPHQYYIVNKSQINNITLGIIKYIE